MGFGWRPLWIRSPWLFRERTDKVLSAGPYPVILLSSAHEAKKFNVLMWLLRLI
jgi:hypothetical protein